MILPQNFYQVDSSKVTSPSSNANKLLAFSAEAVWPADNIDLSLALLTQLKKYAMGIDLSTLSVDDLLSR
jgi:hypothetical protein